MKNHLSFWFIPLIIMLTGCSTRVSTHHRHDGHGYRHHNHVSVGVHGRSSGAGVLGALIVGGIIGSIIHDQHHQDDETAPQQAIDDEGRGDLQEKEEIQSSSAEELTNGYPIDGEVTAISETNEDNFSKNDAFQQAKQQQAKAVEWYQVGKDGNCYLMAVNNGITDVVAAAPDSSCND